MAFPFPFQKTSPEGVGTPHTSSSIGD